MSMGSLHAPADLRSVIEDRLRLHLAERTTAAHGYGPAFEQLWELASVHALGGKLVRPLLLVDAFDALVEASGLPLFAETPRDTVIELAVAIELLHYSFLLHDDVIDGDLIRRRRPNLIGDLRSSHPAGDASGADQHWAMTGGILMGDLLLAAAHQIFARANVTHERRLRLLDLLDHTTTESVAGEHVDVGLSDGVVTPDLHTILTMTAHKTATYSFELPLRAAAILAGADQAVEHTLAAAGRHLGLAFQLQDDVLSMFGDATQHGKDPFSDLREGKQTVIIAYARMTSAWANIEPSFGRSTVTRSEALAVRDLLTSCGAERFARNLVTEQIATLYEALAGGPHDASVPTELRRVIIELASRLDGRTS